MLPTRVPNLLVNGSSGIAVGMATNIPPHNLGEVVNACIALIDDPDITIAELMQHHPGPGLPDRRHHQRRAGNRHRLSRPAAAACTCARAPTIEEDDKGRQAIIITELPYQVNKARLLERIAELVRDKIIEGIARDACATSPTRTACASSSSSSAAKSPTSC